MALTQSALIELLKELELTDTTERFRLLTQRALQELINAEATAVIGAAPYERASDRTTQRNGTRLRTLTTTADDLELKIPKLREGSFFPSLLERRRRVDQALFAVVMEAYVHGVSTRKVDDLVRALGADSGISKSEVSRICAGLNKEIKRRTNVVGTFPNPEALLRLTGHVLIEQHDEWDSADRRYFSENSMKLLNPGVEGVVLASLEAA